MNEGIALAALIARQHIEKTAVVAEGIVGAGKILKGTGKAITGAGKAWGEGAEAIGKSVTRQLGDAGVKGARTKGAITTGALKAAPWLAGGYAGYKAFEPEVHSAKQRLGEAMRGRVALYKARRRAALPYYNEGRFQ